MSKLYQPSNGSEGVGFISEWCDNCKNDQAHREDPDRGEGCEILLMTMAYSIEDPEYPKEWIIASDGPRCTAFIHEDTKSERLSVAVRDEKTVDMFAQQQSSNQLR